MLNTIKFTRARNDVNGNPRYICHFTHLDVHGWESNIGLSERYAMACKLANRMGGRKHHTKAYGGGIVFTSYCLDELTRAIGRVTKQTISGYTLT
jgi:hypothetical protein